MEIEKLIHLVGHISPKNIATLQRYTRKNLELFKNNYEEGNMQIADIGTCAGKSAIAMALVDESIFVHTVDPLPAPSLFTQIEDSGIKDQIAFYKMTSNQFGPQCPNIHGCFIDGLHTYQGVVDDINNVVSRVIPGYYVMFHDVNLYSDTIGKAVSDYENVVYEKIEVCEGEDFGDNDKAASIYVGRKL